MSENILYNRLCEMLDIEYPIIQASMGSAAGPGLAAAVSNAGALGTLGMTRNTPEQIRDWIKRVRDKSDKPFACGFLLPAQLDDNPTSEELDSRIPEGHKEYAAKLMKEEGFPPHDGFYWALAADTVKRQVEVVCEEGVPIFLSGQGAPKWAVDMCHQAGMKFLALIGNVTHAKRAVEAGADAILVHGNEGGGHAGRVTSFVATPWVVDAVAPVPVVHGGGVCDGRGLVAALALGADGALVGTRFVATPESCNEYLETGYFNTQFAIDAWKQRLVEGGPEEAQATKMWTGKMARYVLPDWIKKWEKEGPPALPMPLQNILVKDLWASSQYSGKVSQIIGGTGQVMGRINELKPAAQVVEEMVAEATEVLHRMCGWKK